MKYRVLFIPILLLLIAFSACSEKDNKPTDVKVYGYQLDQFIAKNAVTACVDCTAADSSDFRNLFAYEIVSATDGFSPRNSSYAGYDLDWNTFRTGFVVPDDNKRTWFNNPTLPGAFRVRDTGIFRLYRKIDVHAGSRSTVMVELMGLPIQQIQNWDGEMEAAIKLSDLVQGIASYDSLKIVCWDGYGADKFYQPEWIAGGYYLLGSEVTIFPGINLPNNQRKMKKVSFIEVSGATSAQNHVFELAPNSSANLSFDLPNDLSPYIKTHLVDFGSK